MIDMILEREKWEKELNTLEIIPRSDFQLGALWWQLTEQQIDMSETRITLLKKLEAKLESRIGELTVSIDKEKGWVRATTLR